MVGTVRAVAAIAALVALGAPAAASAVPISALSSSCKELDAADGTTADGPSRLPFFRCDDGVPNAGGRVPNSSGAAAVEVPAAYEGFAGLPARDAAAAASVPGQSGGNVALDVDVALPDPRVHSPAGGYPLVVFMHGCCGGSKTSWQAETIDDPGAEKWHHSDAWFAARGYAVLTYTARGFVDGTDRGSTGETQLDHRGFEINDFQHLAGQMADSSFTVAGQTVTVDPARVVTIGGSYGGGFSWLALTDPVWRSPGGKDMRLVASAPKYGWTDLAYSLVPNGAHLEGRLPAFDGSDTAEPLGFPKRSIVAALYGTGSAPAGAPHTTFPAEITQAFACLESPLPVAANPSCGPVISQVLPSFIQNRSAYYQTAFFDGLRDGSAPRVPVYSAGTLTDPLFPGREHRRMAERLQAAAPDYPIRQYFGDYQHFVQNKRKEWSDLCGADRHVCTLDDYPGGDLNADPPTLARRGPNDDLSDFVDHFAKPPANRSQPRPEMNVIASLQDCSGPEPGPRFGAASFGGLAPNRLRFESGQNQTTTSKAVPNLHAARAEPLANQVSNGARCPSGAGPAGPGVATYDGPRLERDYTMIGPGRVTVPYTATGTAELQLNARLYDVPPDGDPVMVDRGFRTLTAARGEAVIDLLGNGWRFERGHRVRVELAQDDDPFIKAATVPSSMTLGGATVSLPVREAAAAPDTGSAPDREAGDETADGRGGGDAATRTRGVGATGTLPFTGLNLLPLAALGLTLLLAGFWTRVTFVQSSQARPRQLR